MSTGTASKTIARAKNSHAIAKGVFGRRYKPEPQPAAYVVIPDLKPPRYDAGDRVTHLYRGRGEVMDPRPYDTMSLCRVRFTNGTVALCFEEGLF